MKTIKGVVTNINDTRIGVVEVVVAINVSPDVFLPEEKVSDIRFSRRRMSDDSEYNEARKKAEALVREIRLGEVTLSFENENEEKK